VAVSTLLCAAVFHPLGWISGGCCWAGRARNWSAVRRRPLTTAQPPGAFLAAWPGGRWRCLLLPAVPPSPTMAANRQPGLFNRARALISFCHGLTQPHASGCACLRQRTGTPKLTQGDPRSRSAASCLPVPVIAPAGAPALCAVALVRCGAVACRALPADQPTPEADLWLAIEGVMGERNRGRQNRSVVRVRRSARSRTAPNGRWNHERPAMKSFGPEQRWLVMLPGRGRRWPWPSEQLLVRMPPRCNPCARPAASSGPRR